ncbi:hypothetical protein HC891_02650 [Candidatus Gracilibacteria bacterium]|nr:hypothetical protein [Candidatus Gracilibacteria bacterium]
MGSLPWAGHLVAALAAALAQWLATGDPQRTMFSAIAALGYGWVYWRSGKVTAAAVAHALAVWLVALL